MINQFILASSQSTELIPYVLITMSLISLQCFLIPMVTVSKVRFRVFTQDFMDRFRESI